MNLPDTIESNIYLLDSMIASTNQLICLLKNCQNVGEQIHKTVKHILIFISITIKLIPEILFSKHNSKISQIELLKTSTILIKKWGKFPAESNEFLDAWNEFVFWWEEFSKVYKQIQKEKTIQLYMN